MSRKKRPPVRIRFKYNKDTGDIEDFIIDDSAPAASEAYHDKIAEAIANQLGRSPEIQDAGPVRLAQREREPVEIKQVEAKEEKPEEVEEQE